MITAISAYIKNIVGLLVMTALGEMIIPNGASKKYVRFVLGLIVIAAVVEPLIVFMGGEMSFDLASAYALGEADLTKQKKEAEDILKEETEKVCSNAATELGYETEFIKVYMNGGKIEKIDMEISGVHREVAPVTEYGEEIDCEICKAAEKEIISAVGDLTGTGNISVKVRGD